MVTHIEHLFPGLRGTAYRVTSLEHHLITVRAELDHFGIADPTTFAAKLQKAG